MKIPAITELALLLFLTSCASTVITRIPGGESVTSVSVAKYAEKGFLFTPVDYKGKFKSIGMIFGQLSQEARVVESANHGDNISQSVAHQWIKERIIPDALIDTVYQNAVSMGADAIMNFTITAKDSVYNKLTSDVISVKSYTFYGFAIKREE